MSSATIRERHFVTEEQWVGRAGVLLRLAECLAIVVSSTFSHDCVLCRYDAVLVGERP